MVTVLRWIAIATLAAMTFMHAGLTTSLVWHMYRYDVPGAWIGGKELDWQLWTAPITALGLLVLMRYAKPTERKTCIAILSVVTVSFVLFLFLHLTDRLTLK